MTAAALTLVVALAAHTVVRLGRRVGEPQHAAIQRCVSAASTATSGEVICDLSMSHNLSLTALSASPASPAGIPAAAATGPLRVPLTVTGGDRPGGDPTGELSGLSALPAEGWFAVDGRPGMWTASVPSWVGDETPEQVFCDDGIGQLQWMPEARWPNVALPPGAPADVPGGEPLPHDGLQV